MLDTLAEKPLIEKKRYKIPAGDDLTWEIDEFLGDNAGLIVAELEKPERRPSLRQAHMAWRRSHW